MNLLGCAGRVLLVTPLQAWTSPTFCLYSFLVWPHGALHIPCDLPVDTTFLSVACTRGYHGKGTIVWSCPLLLSFACIPLPTLRWLYSQTRVSISENVVYSHKYRFGLHSVSAEFLKPLEFLRAVRVSFAMLIR